MLGEEELGLELERRGLGKIRRLELDRLRLEAERDQEYRVAFLRILGEVERRRDSDPVETAHALTELVDTELKRVGDNNVRLHGGDPEIE